MLHLSGYSLRTPKMMERWDDCEDFLICSPELGVVAMTDGAGQSFFPKPWAEILAENYIAAKARNDFSAEKWLEDSKRAWNAFVRKKD